jgi:predicted branched-subunit amino acid permease
VVGAVGADGRREAVRRGLSVGVATAVYGVSYGAVAVASGLSVLQACVTSALLFSGGSQFALVGVLGAGGGPAAAVGASTLLGVRNGLYGLQLSPLLGLRGPRRVLAAHLTIDESTAVGVGGADREARSAGFWAAGLTVFVGWNAMTLVGALAGNALGDPRRFGLDAAAAAAFLALLWPRLRRPFPEAAVQRRVALGGAVVALVLTPFVPPGLQVIAAVVAVALAGPPRRTTGEAA